MRPVVSDAAFALRIALCAWAAWVPVLRFVSDQGQRRPVVVIERSCEVDDSSLGCGAARSCAASGATACTAQAGEPDRTESGAPRARCCVCFFVGDLSMVAAPAVVPARPMPSVRAPLAQETAAPSRDLSPPSPPPELS